MYLGHPVLYDPFVGEISHIHMCDLTYAYVYLERRVDLKDAYSSGTPL